MESDDELISRCCREPAAFRDLIERFKLRLYSFILHLAGHGPADDLFQEVWIKVFQNAPRYEPRGKAASWLFKIANNACLDHFRRTKRAFPEAQAGDAPDPLPGPQAVLEQDEVRRRIGAAISSLPLEQQQVFLMREFGEMPFKEVAEVLDIPLGTALSRMNAALTKLRKHLEDLRA